MASSGHLPKPQPNNLYAPIDDLMVKANGTRVIVPFVCMMVM